MSCGVQLNKVLSLLEARKSRGEVSIDFARPTKFCTDQNTQIKSVQSQFDWHIFEFSRIFFIKQIKLHSYFSVPPLLIAESVKRLLLRYQDALKANFKSYFCCHNKSIVRKW